MKKLLAAALALLALGCSRPGEVLTNTTNPEFKVERLFEHEGCQVYRFWDNRAVYYVVCDSVKSQASWVESCGRGCTRQMTTPTTQLAKAS